MESIALKIKGFFSNGHERTLKAKKNVAVSVLLRGVNIAVGFILIPMTIDYVNPVQYGIWLTLSTIIAWFNFFDIGLGNGLKNKLAEANALGDYKNAKMYVSTTYAILLIIALILFSVFSIFYKYINWGAILNSNVLSNESFSLLGLLLAGIFCVQFVVQLINIVLTSNHQPSKVSLISSISQIICCLTIFVMKKVTAGSLIKLLIVFGGIPVLVQLVASIWLYLTDYKVFAPQIKSVNLSHAKSLLNTGGVFFIIQIGALILFQTDNIVITQLLGPKQVTVFNVVFKLFSTISMVFTIIITPLWSAFTDAYTKNDMDWIKHTLKKMKKYWCILTGLDFVLLILSPLIYKVWLHNSIEIPFFISLAMALQISVNCWQIIHVYFLNGTGKVRLQLYMVILSSIINLPLAIILGKHYGIVGVTFANVIIYLVLGIVFSIQSNKIINGTATKLWAK
ncbi:lipopolysaccharide biosynthesis protein [Mucilaginibacter endophyticus]|uniref:lipopolysaccharide biosynthesis protein n=1 Tax=Mucilaginibacter endophyticus TaxID=2675003 RepID=UPI000E0CE0AD|nr:oligosaccharide flippase family protein [Mucilaginibacter endophyticus]